tara:strand:- start:3 stop:230 length:228 start_codon:yes stop_codon:yes gene_type:complete
MKIRYYRIICLKRSKFRWAHHCDKSEKVVYWRKNRAGYTEDRSEAGLYSGDDLNLCAGRYGDWILEPAGWFENEL